MAQKHKLIQDSVGPILCCRFKLCPWNVLGLSPRGPQKLDLGRDKGHRQHYDGEGKVYNENRGPQRILARIDTWVPISFPKKRRRHDSHVIGISKIYIARL